MHDRFYRHLDELVVFLERMAAAIEADAPTRSFADDLADALNAEEQHDAESDSR